jgi:transcriptional regulator with XRE-family HTH domain
MERKAATPEQRGLVIRQLRKKAGLTQQQLADKCLVDRSTIIRAEKGGEMTPATGMAIGVALGYARDIRKWSDEDVVKLEALAPVEVFQGFDRERADARKLGLTTDIRDWRSLVLAVTVGSALTANKVIRAILEGGETNPPNVDDFVREVVAQDNAHNFDRGLEMIEKLAANLRRDIQEAVEEKKAREEKAGNVEPE